MRKTAPRRLRAAPARRRAAEPARPPAGGPGRPLEPPVRSAMEQRLGHQLGRIRIHDGGAAAAAAERAGARAFTWGHQIWFGRGEYRPETAEGSRLLAHELVHTRQQERLGRRLQRVPIHGRDPGRLEEEAERLGGSGGQGAGGSRAGGGAGAGAGRGGARAAQRPGPPRGTDPAACIEPLCDRVAAPPVPASEAAARQRSQGFQADAFACLAAGAAASNASHHVAIRAAAEDELRQAVRDLEADLPASARRRGGLRDWLAGLGDLCRRQRREIGIEFHYNVVFEQSGQPWGFHPAEWGSLDAALAALPEEATWTNPLLLRFRRAECHPDDVDPATGACRIVRTVGGEADPSTGRITVFRTGLGSQPMGRSRETGVSTTAQVLRHEVGHVVMEQVPQAERDFFFTTLLGWRDYSWAWVTARNSPHATWTAERAALRSELGMTEDQLDAWLAGLRQDVPVEVRGFVYTRGRSFLARVRRDALPAGPVFEYARTARGEYLAELYALAVSAPGFLHDALPADQVAWLKRAVFGTPSTPQELAREVALGEPLQSRFLAAAARLFTWPQIEALLARLTAGRAAGGEAG